LEQILHVIGGWVANQIDALGYMGVVIMMAIESACIPLPSEVIMPYGGYLVSLHPEKYSVWWMGVAGAVGCVVGSVVAYYAGYYGGRPFVEKYGKYILIRHSDLDKADKFFAKYGDWAVFISRLLPVVRTFISFPVGIARTNMPRFILYTFLGSLPWCYALAYVGHYLGKNWASIKNYFHGADIVIGVLILLGIAYWVWHHFKPEKVEVSSEEDEKVGCEK
jgi:membrane protein DedA with SNARE-associated domain